MATSHQEEMQTEVQRQRLSEEQRRSLQQRLQGVDSPVEDESIKPRPPGALVPLSAEQRRVWLHALQQPDVPIYNEPFTLHRQGSFDLGILKASIQEILSRHEAWGTSFSPDGQQIVHERVEVNLPFTDLSELPPLEREAEALRIATEDARTPIRLDEVPLFRLHVVRMTADEHRLYLSFHHIIFDGVSIAKIFVPELATVYKAFEQGKPSPLPPLPVQYGDYALWREKQLNGPVVKQHLDWWLRQLSGELPVLHLLEDRPRPSITGTRGGMECFDIRPELVRALRRIGNEQGVTPYMTLLAAFKVLLFRLSGQNDLIVGSAIDSRRRPELDGLMGYFLNTFVVRTRPFAEMTFAEYLAQTRDAALDGIAASDVPFDRIVRELNPKRTASQHPIFQAFFTIRPPMPPVIDGWRLTPTDVSVGTSKFDLCLELGEWPDYLEGRFLYSSDIWDPATIRRMAACWQVLLQDICRSAGSSTLGTLEILTPEEKAKLFNAGGWNDTARPFPQATLDALLDEQARRTPKSIAATFGNDLWTYQQLSARADAIAAGLRRAGVTRGSIVAVALDRSLDLLAGLIAVLKTGAAYLPVDIHSPRERISLCLADAAPAAILTQGSLRNDFTSTSGALVLVEQCGDEAVPGVSAPTPAAVPKKEIDDTAYLMYTSGTTGEPKAVEISHRSLVNLLASMQSAPGFGPEDVLLAVTPISFDIATLELFLPLLSGGTVAIATRDQARDPALLAQAIEASRCTVIQATPSSWRTLLLSGWDNGKRSPSAGSAKPLRVLCGGEALPRELANRLLATGVELWNMYGPTETTIWSVINNLSLETGMETGPVSVGRPIANTTAYILDPQLQPVSIGVPGELYLGGVGLAKGYRGRPQQTADRFLKVSSVGGERLYRTGDVAVRRADGAIEIQGRTDNQVKVRGYRFELEAVEAAVLRHPQVAAAAARVWPEATGDMRLSVYVAAKSATPPGLAELRAFLGKSLPESMIPSDVVTLPSIPLTPHGKVDRSKLPRPAVEEASGPSKSVESPEEQALAAIWADLLGRQHIGPEDDFFDLGGHSLLLAALQQRIGHDLGRNVPMVELLYSPTIRQQARIIRGPEMGTPTLPPGVLALQQEGTGESVFWAHYLVGNLAQVIGNHHPFFSLGLTPEDFETFSEAPYLEEIATCLVQKLRATQPEGPYVLGGLCVGGILAYEIAAQLTASGQKVSLVVLLDAPNPVYFEKSGAWMLGPPYFRYLAKRIARIGVRKSIAKSRDRLYSVLPRALRGRSVRTELKAANDAVEAAAIAYRPKEYTGRVLLLQPRERPPHIDFLIGWKKVITGDLYTLEVEGHHDELHEVQDMRRVAEEIIGHLAPKRTKQIA